MFRTFKSSITILPWFLASVVVALCSASRRTFDTRAWTAASFALALRRFIEPRCFRLNALLSRLSLR